MSGCDISSSLVEQTRKTYPDMDLFTGTIWDINKSALRNVKYDIVYCIRSSWYMQDFLRVIQKMLHMTRKNGYVVFNIINRQNQDNKKALAKNRFQRVKGRIEGALKVLLLNRDYFASCPAYYYTKSEIENLLRSINVKWKVLSTNQLFDREAKFDECGQKLLFIVQKL